MFQPAIKAVVCFVLNMMSLDSIIKNTDAYKEKKELSRLVDIISASITKVEERHKHSIDIIKNSEEKGLDQRKMVIYARIQHLLGKHEKLIELRQILIGKIHDLSYRELFTELAAKIKWLSMESIYMSESISDLHNVSETNISDDEHALDHIIACKSNKEKTWPYKLHEVKCGRIGKLYVAEPVEPGDENFTGYAHRVANGSWEWLLNDHHIADIIANVKALESLADAESDEMMYHIEEWALMLIDYEQDVNNLSVLSRRSKYSREIGAIYSMAVMIAVSAFIKSLNVDFIRKVKSSRKGGTREAAAKYMAESAISYVTQSMINRNEPEYFEFFTTTIDGAARLNRTGNLVHGVALTAVLVKI